MTDQNQYHPPTYGQQHPPQAMNTDDNSSPSAFWRNPVFNNNFSRMREVHSTSPPNPRREELFKRPEATLPSPSNVDMSPRMVYHPGPPPPLSRPSASTSDGEEGSAAQQYQQQQQQQQQGFQQGTGGNSNVPPRRTRITRACDTCRRKKIKCDVDATFPCTTCKQYVWECTFNDTAKKRGPPKGYIESLETRLKKMEELLEKMQSGKQHGESGSSSEPISTPGHKRKRSLDETRVVARSAEDGNTGSKHDNPAEGADKITRYHGSSSGLYLMRNMFPATDKTKTHGDTMRPIEGEELPSYGNNPAVRVHRLSGFDDDLMLVRDALESDKNNAEDTEELVPRKIMETLVDLYFDVSNATLPIVNKQEYIDAFQGRTSPPPPILLTYAICTYSCFVISSDHPVFRECKMSCDQVFHTLSDRTSYLVRRDYLKSGISTIKALVILCSQPTYSTSSYRNWIIAGMAVRMAQDLGLHRTVRSEEISKEKIEASKRLWYSVYVTDRWCCAAMGRPLAIADSDCDVDLPDPQGTGKEDYNIFVNFIKLSGILGEVLRRIYSPKAKAAGYRSQAAMQTVTNLQKMLSDWFIHLPDDCRITEQDLVAIQQNPDQFVNTKKLEQGGPLTVCYHSVTLLLHRPFIVLENENVAVQQDQQENVYTDAARRCMDAARLTIEIARVVPAASIARFGWNFSVYSVFQATLIHVYNCTSNDPHVAKTAQEYVRIGKDCLTDLTRDIPYGPPIIPFLEKLIALLGADPSKRKENDSPEQGAMSSSTAAASGSDVSSSNANTPTTAAPIPVQQQQQQQQQSTATGSPMSVQQMMADNTNTGSASGGSSSSNEPQAQATWQQLFSSAGTPFTNDSTGFDLQAWTNFLSGNQSTAPLFFIP